MRCVKQQLIIEFEDYNESKLTHALNNDDDMNISILTNELRDFVEKNISLRENFFYLISFKHFFENADEVAVEHYNLSDKSKPWNLIS